jgi:hypothetical protein
LPATDQTAPKDIDLKLEFDALWIGPAPSIDRLGGAISHENVWRELKRKATSRCCWSALSCFVNLALLVVNQSFAKAATEWMCLFQAKQGSKSLCALGHRFSPAPHYFRLARRRSAMTIFPLDITRFPELFEVYFLRWRHSTHVELENLSDKNLRDIGWSRTG